MDISELYDNNEVSLAEDILFSGPSSSSTESEYEDESNSLNILQNIASYSEVEFKLHFRLGKNSVAHLIAQYQDQQEDQRSVMGRPLIAADKQIYIYLWYMANTVTFRQLGHLFDVSKSTAWKCVNKVAAFLVNISPAFIQWPEGSDVNTTVQGFESIRGIPGVIGAIDGTHIEIKAPKENAQDYFNRKKYHSIALQLVVDPRMRIIDVYCGEPGSVHDARMLRRSELYKRIEENENFIPGDLFLLGDSAYPQKRWLITPFKDYGNLNETQHRFNNIHSSTRVVVENAIGLLKARFRCLLHFTEQTDIALVVNVVYSACVLHNICLLRNNQIETVESSGSQENEQYLSNLNEEFLDRREQLLDQLRRNNIF